MSRQYCTINEVSPKMSYIHALPFPTAPQFRCFSRSGLSSRYRCPRHRSCRPPHPLQRSSRPPCYLSACDLAVLAAFGVSVRVTERRLELLKYCRCRLVRLVWWVARPCPIHHFRSRHRLRCRLRLDRRGSRVLKRSRTLRRLG